MGKTKALPRALVLCDGKAAQTLHAKYQVLSDPQLLNNLASHMRKKYNDYIDRLSLQNSKQIDWWVSSLGSRNTHAGKSFYNLVYLVYCDQMLAKYPDISAIFVTSEGLQKSLQKINIQKTRTNCHIELIRTKNNKIRLPHAISLVRDSSSFILKQLKLNLAAKLSSFIEKSHYGCKNIVLLDTFVFDFSFSSGEFLDSYFPALTKYLPKVNWFYLPTLFKQSRPVNCFLSMRRNKVPFLIAEDFLKLNDYLWAAAHPLRMRRLALKFTKINGYDVHDIFQEAIDDHLTLNSTLEALLKYRLCQRLKEHNVDIKSIVDWFENQDIDKGQNAGFKKYYSHAIIIGYQGFVAPCNYLCTQVTTVEKNAGVIPDKVAVIGPMLTQSANEFCPTLDVFVAPAFRFQHLFKQNQSKPVSSNKVLIALPFRLDLSLELLRLIDLANSNLTSSIEYVLKPHPRGGYYDRIIDYLMEIGAEGKTKVSSTDLSEIFPQIGLMISNASSTCLEAICLGVPVIIAGSDNAPLENVLPKGVNEEFYRVCYTKSEIEEAVHYFIESCDTQRAMRVNEASILNEAYFTPVTDKTIHRFAEKALIS